ncbi:GntR family transcriptional regulator [Erysipelothrix larvae]|uniref:GntR family transcriptional regulator n=1 Tax=Erysipelothrix larvae TaxID=1514105 RepID=A0A120JTP7_9FIRM|nr:TrkA C-terminal domain-containing protein [Erysipelothrix larvae]AMC93556.1 GntR family transcriptional regulator [Erysipelothrix larvae]
MRKVKRSIYQKIAVDLASRIASNDIKVGMKLSGRSTLSSEYGVSPETIRRATNLLHEQGVVEIKNNMGVIVKDKHKAVQYLESMESAHDVTELRHQLSELMQQRQKLDREIDRVINQLVDLTGRFSSTDPLKRFELVLAPESQLVGKTIKGSQFFQQTGMTIVALNKNGNMILSPGPNALFEAGDTIVVMGSVRNMNDLETWIKEKN